LGKDGINSSEILFPWQSLAILCRAHPVAVYSLAEKHPLKFGFQQLTEFQLMGGGLAKRKRVLFCRFV